MDPIAIAFWGGFVCAAFLLLAGSAMLLVFGMRWAALIGVTAAATPLVYSLAFLGWLSPQEESARERFLTDLSVVSGIALGWMLLALLGQLRRGRAARVWLGLLTAIGLLVAVGSRALSPHQGLIVGCTFDWVVGAAMLWIGFRYAFERHRLAVEGVAGVVCILVGMACMDAIALSRGGVTWHVHALAAVAGIAYFTVVGFSLSVRVIHLLELRQVLSLGPTYDPVTRMHAYTETGKVVGAYFRKASATYAVGVVAISLANLRPLESLHGRAAQNHALFICASRLRHSAPLGAELCRLSDDGFLLLMLVRNEDERLLTDLARRIRRRLVRPINLRVGEGSLESDFADWTPELGIGIALSAPHFAPGTAVAAARAGSRSAWTFASRMSICEPGASGRFTELPLAVAEG